jgi:hypothetical protein
MYAIEAPMRAVEASESHPHRHPCVKLEVLLRCVDLAAVFIPRDDSEL